MSNEMPDPTAIKETIRRHWASRAAEFDLAPNHGLHNAAQHDAWLARLRGWAGSEPLDVLDIGCGTGFLALLLAELGHRATGVDAADEMLERARAKADAAGLSVTFRSANAERLPFADASFDLVVERHVIWTLPDPVGALKEWVRVLRPGGRLVLVEGDWRSSDSTPKTLADYAPILHALPLYGGRPADELSALVLAAGLIEPQIEPLMEAVLWGEEPQAERYALQARRPRG